MKRPAVSSACLLLTFFLIFPVYCAFSQSVRNTCSRSFQKPDSTSRPLTWWHWINGNVSKAGIRKDLEDMKRVGIGGVQLFDTHMYLPKGPVRYGSDSWHAHVQYALRVCDSLGLEFYMVNSPGWSGSGGPWISPEQSMKQLVYSETVLPDAEQRTIRLPQPYRRAGFYRDIAVLAVPAGQEPQTMIREQRSKIAASGFRGDLYNIFDKDVSTFSSFDPQSHSREIDFRFAEEITTNALLLDIGFPGGRADVAGSVEVSDDGKSFRELATIKFVDHRAKEGNFVIPFPEVYTRFIRVRFEGSKGFGDDFQIREVSWKRLSGSDDWYKKTGMTKTPLQEKPAPGKPNAEGIPKDSILDLTPFFDPSSGTLSWSPPGKWTILRFGYTTTGKMIHPAQEEGTGYEVDKLDPEAVEFQFKQSLGRIIHEAGDLTGKAFKGIVFDSFEGGYQNWTGDLPAMFLDMKGYDLHTYLPAFTGRAITSSAVTEAFLWDFRQTISALIAKNYRGTMQNLAHKNHLLVYSETQGGPMAPAVGNAFVDVPMNEFWTNGIEKRGELIRQTASIAHILGRRIVAAESFTSRPEYGRWQNVPRNLKRTGDYAFAAGINRFIFHTYTHQPYEVVPGFTMGRYGTHFGRTNTWWKYAGAWITYLSRSQYLLQQGERVADICYLYPEDAIYDPLSGQPEMPAGFTVDICYPQALNTMEVRDGRATVPSGAGYRLIVLPDYPLMELKTLRKISDLLANGAIVLGNPPSAPPDLKGTMEESAQFAKIAEQLWGDPDGKIRNKKQVGKGWLYRGLSPAEVLKDIREVPDLEFSGTQVDSLLFAHRKAGERDIYFISNQAGEKRVADTYFRVRGKHPEIWDAKTGEIANVPFFDTIGGRTQIPLHLQPGGSVFIVFSQPLPDNRIPGLPSAGRHRQAEQLPEEARTIRTPWRLVMREGQADSLSMQMSELILWNEHPDSALRYYSGEGTYYNHFVLESRPGKSEKLLLNTGEIYDIAAVYINQKRAGVIWENPGVIDITDFVKKGENQLTIKVVNRWVNRLIGDESLPAALRYADKGSIFTRGRLLELPDWLTAPEPGHPGARQTFTTWQHYHAGSPLLPSGLKGPVRLLFYTDPASQTRIP